MNNFTAETNRNIVSIIDKQKERIPTMEHLLGASINIPSKCSNSAPRIILAENQGAQRLDLYYGETSFLQTGYETQQGERSSEFIRTEDNLKVIAKISKYKYAQDHHYFLIVQNQRTLEYDIIERISYNHSTESYGFLYNNKYLDAVRPNYIIPKGIAIKKSNSYDEYNNRKDGVNLDVTYLCNEETKEDSIIISDYAAEKLSAPLIENISNIVNENDIPLNIYGDDNNYKCFPDIGEEIANGVVMATRPEKKSEIFYSQSNERLKNISMSDIRYSLKGQVVEINVYCNNPELLQTNEYYAQFKYYYDQQMDFYKEFVNAADTYTEPSKHSYKLQKLLYTYNQILEGKQVIKDKAFSNILIEIIAVEMNPVRKGDKITNRYGGKGVVSEIRAREKMPKHVTESGEIIYTDVIYNSNTCVNRENPGQLFEMSTNFAGRNISDKINSGLCTPEQSMEMYYTFLRIIAPDLYTYMKNKYKADDLGTMIQILESIKKDKGIHVSQKPITEVMTVDKLKELYNALPWIEQYKVQVPQRSSNGDIRYIYARRRMVISKQYIYRLKQYAEEKFSVVSLGTTNIKNENSRNSLKKQHKSPYSKASTKVLSDMETMDLLHVGAENIITILMLHSSSPTARRLAQQLLVDDPFEVDVKLNENCKNRSVEIVNTYLRTLGLKLIFKKVPKKLKKFMTRQYNFMTRIPEGEKIKFMTRTIPGEKQKFMTRLNGRI